MSRLSIDPHLARVYALPEPRAYILKLVQWAVARGARLVQIEIGPDEVSLQHDGEGEEEEQFPPTPVAGHLGVALATIAALDPREIYLESSDFKWTNGSVQLVPYPRRGSLLVLRQLRNLGRWNRSPMLGSQLATTFTHIDTEGSLGNLMWDSLGLVRPEVALVRQRCFLAGARVVLNGKTVNRPAGLHYKVRGTDLVQAAGRKGPFHFVLARTWKPGQLAVPARLKDVNLTFLNQEGEKVSAGEPSADLTVGGQPALTALAASYQFANSESGSRLYWVCDGVLLNVQTIPSREARDLFCHCNGLSLQPGQFLLAEDNEYRQRLSWLRRVLEVR